MNAAFHLVAILVLGLLVWMWSEERSKHKLIVSLLKQYTKSQISLSPNPLGTTYHQIYLRKPFDFIVTLCQAFEISHDIQINAAQAPKPAKINPIPLLELILLNQVHKISSQIKPGQKPEIIVWVQPPSSTTMQSPRLVAALGGDLEVSIVHGDSVLSKT